MQISLHANTGTTSMSELAEDLGHRSNMQVVDASPYN